MSYVYKGTKPDAPESLTAPAVTELPVRDPSTPGPKPRPGVFDPSKCGTHAGYRQHRRYGIDPCDPCLAGNREYHQQWRAAQPPKAPKVRAVGIYDPESCGTPQGYDRHIYRGTDTCLPCRAANTEKYRKYRAARRAA